MQVTVRDFMTQGVVTVTEQTPIPEAVELAIREELDELYVTDAENRLMGIVPDYELLKALVLGDMGNRQLGELMSFSYSFLRPETPVGEVTSVFREFRYRQLPVVENGRVIGRVCRRDVLRLLAVLERLEADGSSASVGNAAPPPAPVLGPRYLQAPSMRKAAR